MTRWGIWTAAVAVPSVLALVVVGGVSLGSDDGGSGDPAGHAVPAPTAPSSAPFAGGVVPDGTGTPSAPSSPSVPVPTTPGKPSKAPAAGRGPLAGKVIVIDPGHNGANGAHPAVINRQVPAGSFKKACDTTGTATNAGYPEHAFTFDVSTRLARILRAQGATVRLTRADDDGVGPCINQRAAFGNNAHADAAISIHGDGAPSKGHGFHVILPGRVKGYTEQIVAPSRRLGLDIRDAFRTGADQPYSTYLGDNAIDVRTDLGGLNLSKVPKVFIECGNMRNGGDAAKMTSAAWRQRAAQALAAGFAAFLR